MARDSKYYRLSEAPLPYLYLPFRQMYSLGHAANPSVAFYVRTTGDPRAALATARRAAKAINANVNIYDAMPLVDYNTTSLFPQKVAASLLGVLGILALLLAAVGLYSIMAYAVSQRTQEIGIRMALGAGVRDVLRMVLGRGMALTAAGLAAGSVAALATTRLLAGMLVNVSATDPASFAGAALFLVVVAAAACYLPARRATRIEVGAALRRE